MNFKSVVNGLLGNVSEISKEELIPKYTPYLISGEVISTGFITIRDVIVFTDKRIIVFNKEQVGNKKMKVFSIYLHSIVGISIETAGIGIDDSEIKIKYIKTPNYNAFNLETDEHKIAFPKSFDIQSLYRTLEEIAYDNIFELNKFTEK